MQTTCTGTSKDGTPCSARAWRDGLCRWHHPELEAERAQWRREGGAARGNKARARKALAESGLSMNELEGVLALTLSRVLSGELAPNVGNAAATIARTLVAVREVSQLEARLAALEDALGTDERTA